MIEISIPQRGAFHLEHLVCDVNGTLALDGNLIEGVSKIIGLLREQVTVHLLTADTFGRQSLIDQQLNLTAIRLKTGHAAGDEARQKAEYVEQLGAERVIAIGQGANDAQMLRTAAIGICILSAEGCAVETLIAADLVAPNILNALEILQNPLRIVATLRK
jgi:P-type E1-E2 ATPase